MSPRALCFVGSGQKKNPRPGTPGQGCALWPPWPGVIPEANTPSMMTPWLGRSFPGSEEAGSRRRLLRTPSARPPPPEPSPASRLRRAASPSADRRGAPGAAAAPSRALPCPSPRPGGASAGAAALTRARPSPGPAAPTSALRLPAARRPHWSAGGAWRGRGARYRPRGGGAAEARGGDTGGPAPRRGLTCGARTLRLRALVSALYQLKRAGPSGSSGLAPARPPPAFSVFPDSEYSASGPPGRGCWDGL